MKHSASGPSHYIAQWSHNLQVTANTDASKMKFTP